MQIKQDLKVNIYFLNLALDYILAWLASDSRCLGAVNTQEVSMDFLCKLAELLQSSVVKREVVLLMIEDYFLGRN